MADVHIELDDGLIRSLKATADLKGRTLEEELRDIITRAAPLTAEERVMLSDRIRARQAKPSDLLKRRSHARGPRRSMTFVVDANVAVKWFIQQQGIRRSHGESRPIKERLIAPAMLISETTNALWRHVKRGDVPAGSCAICARGLTWWFNELVEDQQLAVPALDLGSRRSTMRPTICFYLASAIDRRLAARDRGPAFH